LSDSTADAPDGTSGAPDVRGLTVVLLTFVALGLFLPVGPEVPIGDSWSYAWSARQLEQNGVLRLTDFQSATLVGQLLLTLPATLLVSSAPAFLNLLTFCFSAVTACILFLLLRAVGTPRASALLGVAALVFNPIYLAQSVTYDTEIYFLFASLLGILAFIRWQHSGRDRELWLSGAAFALAVLIRQHAITFPAAAWVALRWPRRQEDRRMRGARGFSVLASFALAPLALVGFYAWIHFFNGVPKAYSWQQADLRDRLAHPAALLVYALNGILASVHYLGLFLAPMLPGLVYGDSRRRHRLLAYAAAGLVVSVGTGLLWLEGLHMPYLPNGPIASLNLTAGLGRVLTCVSALLAIVLLAEVTSRCLARQPLETPASTRDTSLVFLGASAMLLLAFCIATGIRFERYLLLPFPFLIPLLVSTRDTRVALAGGCLLLVPTLLFSPYFVDQRVRVFACEWKAAQAAVALGYAPFSIDGGFAFNGYYSYERISRLYRRFSSAMPWNPGDHPAAKVLVRAVPLSSATHELLQRHRCANHLGLRDFEMLIYRRKP
jgi:hypothetical protein